MQFDSDPHHVSIAFSPLGDMTGITETIMRHSASTANAMMATWQETMIRCAEIQAGALRDATLSMAGTTLRLPFSGDVNQIIDPDTNWGYIGASPDRGMERAITDNIASYGRQLDWVIELLLDVSGKVDGADADKVEQVAELKRRVELLKAALDKHEDMPAR